MHISEVSSPKDIKNLSIEELKVLAQEIRDTIIGQVSKHGGHLASSLGVVELTLALHSAYETPDDILVWDVGHQAYVHKLLTGRYARFETLRQQHGLSGFLKRSESEYDAFGAGHASTSISAALGFAVARDKLGKSNRVAAIIGDGSLTGGMALEALNNAGALKSDMTIILNDNKMSIAQNVGAFSYYLNSILSDPKYNKIRKDVDSVMHKIPGIIGSRFRDLFSAAEKATKFALKPGRLFEDLGIRYFGPVDGHNLAELIPLLKNVRECAGPCLVHVITEKGRGLELAERNPSAWHGCNPFDPESGLPLSPGNKNPTLTSVFGQKLLEMARSNQNIIGITAAMPSGCGLDIMAKEMPGRVVDVGIAEEHAVTFAAGLACAGMVPVVAIYSSFMQRAYDQIIHDVALQNLHVVLVLDRAGLVGADGPTHHGAFDLTFLRSVPGLTILAPSNENELCAMLDFAVHSVQGPVAIRYPRGNAFAEKVNAELPTIEMGKFSVLERGSDILLLGAGFMLQELKKTASVLRAHGKNPTLVDARFIKPLDTAAYVELFKAHSTIVTLEDNTLVGGFGGAVAEMLTDSGLTDKKLYRFGLPDAFVEHGNISDLYKQLKIDGESIAEKLLGK